MERFAPERDAWLSRSAFFHHGDYAYFRFLVPPGLRVLDLGCGIGDLLAVLRPARGVGIDFSKRATQCARAAHLQFGFHVGDIENPQTFAQIKGPST